MGDLGLLVALFLFCGLGIVLIYWGVKRGNSHMSQIRKAVESRGDVFELLPGSYSKGLEIHIRASDGAWNLTIHQGQPSGPSKSRPSWSEWSTPYAAVSSGAAMWAPKSEVGFGRKFGAINGPVQSFVSNALRRGLTRALDLPHQKMDVIPTPGRAGILLATSDAKQALDNVLDHPQLLALRQGRRLSRQPSVVRDVNGLRIRLQTPLNTAQDVLDVIDLGLTLSQTLDPHQT